MTLTDRSIVVAGCTGQVGRPVATLLAAQGDEVHGLARLKDPSAREEMEAAGVNCHAVDLVDADLSTVPREVDHLLNFAVTNVELTVVRPSSGFAGRSQRGARRMSAITWSVSRPKSVSGKTMLS